MKRTLYRIGRVACVVLLPSALYAQTQRPDTALNRTVVVEQEYAPVIMDAPKVNVLPKVEEPVVVERAVEYAVTPSPAMAIPMGIMSAYTVPQTQAEATPGYLRVGYGNYGNLDVWGNYRFRLSGKDALNVQVGVDGMNGKLDMPDEEAKWKTHYYRARAAVGYTHRFNRIDMDLAAHFGLNNFEALLYESATQQFTMGDFHVGLKSLDDSYPLQFAAETNLMMYNRRHNSSLFTDDGLGETQIHTKGVVSGAIDEQQTILIGLSMQNLFYSKELNLGNGEAVFENRTALALNPRYEFRGDAWAFRLGANVDLSLGAGKSFRASPDVTVEYNFARSYTLYAKATGGKIVNDFRRLEDFCPYAQPISVLNDTYEQVNASLGLKASPCDGLWFAVYGGYQNLKDDMFQVYYQPSLDVAFTDTWNAYGAAELNYSYKDLFELSARGVYRNWDADEAYALLLKPTVECDVNLAVRPLSGLGVRVGYAYAGRDAVEGLSLADVSNLYASAEYTFYRNISVYAHFRNLLGKEYQYYLGYPTEGFNFVGGLSFRF